MSSPLKENLLQKQIQNKFPMEHPLTSQISYKALFPSYTAPEDEKRGDVAVHQTKYIIHDQTPAQVDKTAVLSKFSGGPWRHEVRYQTLPTQKSGLWYYDKEYHHVI